MDKKCVGCDNTENLIELNNGYCSCMDCMLELGKQQNEISEKILNIFIDRNITKPMHIIKILEAFLLTFKYDNNLIDDETKKTMDELKEIMERELNNATK